VIPYFYVAAKLAVPKVLLLSAHILTTLTVGFLTSHDVVMESGNVRYIFRYIKCEGCEKFYVFSTTLSLVSRGAVFRCRGVVF
jgi:hypothetical protein